LDTKKHVLTEYDAILSTSVIQAPKFHLSGDEFMDIDDPIFSKGIPKLSFTDRQGTNLLPDHPSQHDQHAHATSDMNTRASSVLPSGAPEFRKTSSSIEEPQSKTARDPFISSGIQRLLDPTTSIAKKRHAEHIAKKIAQPAGLGTAEIPSIVQQSMQNPKPVTYRRTIAAVTDEDRTLVNDEYHINDSGTSSESGESIASPPMPSGMNESSQGTQEKWKLALKPYQRDMMDTMHAIVDVRYRSSFGDTLLTNFQKLMEHLLDEELAFELSVTSFEREGKQLVHGVQDDLKKKRSKVRDELSTSVDRLFKETKRTKDVITKIKRPAEQSLDDLYNAWRNKQHKLNDRLQRTTF
jgi:hypothetical protein